MNRIRHLRPISRIPSTPELHPDFEAELCEFTPPTRVSNDSQTLSEVVRDEKRRALYLGLALIFLLVAAACIYLIQS